MGQGGPGADHQFSRQDLPDEVLRKVGELLEQVGGAQGFGHGEKVAGSMVTFPPGREPSMLTQLVFLGFNSRVVALDRDTGEVVWQWKSPKGTGYTTVLLDGDRLMVSVEGYTYCLHPLNGQPRWHNDLPGMGTGVVTITTVRGSTAHVAAEAAAEAQREASASTVPT
jgi:outer membrane protein assembly factor BamB